MASNSSAGALNIKTAEPTRGFEGYVTALYEPTHGEKNITAVVSGPLNNSDQLTLSRHASDGISDLVSVFIALRGQPKGRLSV